MVSLLRRIHTLNKISIHKERTALEFIVSSCFHTHTQLLNRSDTKDIVPIYHTFSAIERKEKQMFLDVIRMYVKENSARGHAEFILTALKYMDEFGVNKDLEVYKTLLDILPKGKYIASNSYQIMMRHYPFQQDVAVQLLSKMEDNAVLPDREMQVMLTNIFGLHAMPLKKYFRMIYWMPKFANINPWPVPQPVPTNPRELAQIAINKISSIDVQRQVTEYHTKDVEDSIENTWILSVMSKTQQELLAHQPTDKSLYVEGPFNVWIANYSVDYFVLRGDPIKAERVYRDTDDISNLKIPYWDDRTFYIPLGIYAQEDGVYYAMCATGSSSKDSLLSWIRCLQKTNPILKKLPIVFKLKSRTLEPDSIEDHTKQKISGKQSHQEGLLDTVR